MKKMLCLLLALCFVFALCACGNQIAVEKPNGEETNQSQPTEGQDALDAPEVDQTIDDGKVTYTVKVADEAGNPITAVDKVQVCDETNSCSIIFLTEGQGAIRLTEAEYHATLMSLPEGYEYVGEETEFSFDSDFSCTITLKVVQ